MNKENNIVITGAAGFIGSCLISYLNENGYTKLILVDDFSRIDKTANLNGKQYEEKIEREKFFEWTHAHQPVIDFIFHIGARTDTTEFDYKVHQHFNVEYSKQIWNYCTVHNIPLVYASSAATYGSGEWGYNDDHDIVNKLKPLNPYGESKNEFDKWVLHQHNHPPSWFGLKFFNVYGPNEYHKGRMASVIFHSFNQIKTSGVVKLFKSHRPEYEDGQQLRDFVYVKDVIKVCCWFMENSAFEERRQSSTSQVQNGLYNLGTGKARSFEDLVRSTYAALDMSPNIEYIDMPTDIRSTYQYFTEARMKKLQNSGYRQAFFSLENGIDDYVRQYLKLNNYY